MHDRNATLGDIIAQVVAAETVVLEVGLVVAGDVPYDRVVSQGCVGSR